MKKIENYLKCSVCGKLRTVSKSVMRKAYKNGKISRCQSCAMKSRVLTKEHKDKISKALQGKNAPNWQGGIDPVNRAIRGCREYKEWREKIIEDNDGVCMLCGDKAAIAHHKKNIKTITDEYGIEDLMSARQCKELWDVGNGNGMALCNSCHDIAHRCKSEYNY